MKLNETLEEFGEYIVKALGDDVNDYIVAYGELTILSRRDKIVEVLKFLKDDKNCKFSILLDVCGADYPERPRRFDVVYHMLSMKKNYRVRVKITTDEETPVPSVVPLFSSANWYERETWDMYGVMFAGHPDLRRLLSDYGFDGHPLRKDFPLTGYVELRYSEEEKRVIYEPVKLTQEYRDFDFMSPWEGAKYILPQDDAADEKAEEGAKD